MSYFTSAASSALGMLLLCMRFKHRSLFLLSSVKQATVLVKSKHAVALIRYKQMIIGVHLKAVLEPLLCNLLSPLHKFKLWTA
jgi:hypothetical protein